MATEMSEPSICPRSMWATALEAEEAVRYSMVA
jgi:hypothetical protein